MPLASIVVPAFNAAATLSQTLQSLQAQTHPDYEIIVVDDGSQDTTPLIALEAARNDPRIHVIRQANRGLAGARNSGIAAAKGAFIGFCDAGDIWAPEKLATHVRHLLASPFVGISFSGSEFIDKQGTPLGASEKPRLTDIDVRHVFLRNPIGNASAAVARRAALQDIAWHPRFETQRAWVFDETFTQSEDIECWMRLMLTTHWTIEGVAGTLVRHRVHENDPPAAAERKLASWERMVTRLSHHNHAFFAKHTPAARAFWYRSLARRAVLNRDPKLARGLIGKSLRASLAPLVAEPLSTMATLAGAVTMPTAKVRGIRTPEGMSPRRQV